MMSILLFILFLIPLVNFWWLLVVSFLILSLYFCFFSFGVFFSNLGYGLGCDFISFCMIFLSVWIIMLMIMSSLDIKYKNKGISTFLLLLIFLMLLLFLTFSVFNLFLFYLFFEASMIPTLFLIYGWGYQPERLLAGMYLLFYTLFGSLPMLITIFYIYSTCYTMNFFLISINVNFFIYLCMIFAFLVKMPMIFFHFWLPSAHVEAPVSGSMILAGVLLKLGGYGLYRVYLFLWTFMHYNCLWFILSLFGSFLVGLLCLYQIDIKSLIAYSSVAHMGLVICGLMTSFFYGYYGSLVLMIGHGLCSSGLFALANMIYERSHTRSLLMNKGFLVFMPFMSLYWFIFSVNNMASPISLNLLGELMLINSILSWDSLTFMLISLSSFFSCCYSIYLYSIVQHGSLYSGYYLSNSGYYREFLLLVFHLIPLNLLFLSINLFLYWL
uniref:NADH-ubiquinone oxidoreductase chain 4 n=1 Tax=Largus sp. TaxID=2931298 RepID=A0A8T9ZWD2_9HEMI|nr:NADH dehydrogenase subunit 4 [Largus sp.]